MTATLQTIYRPGWDDERMSRLVSALDELAATLGLDAPPPADMGGNYSFYGTSAAELREKLGTIKTHTRGLFDGVTENDD